MDKERTNALDFGSTDKNDFSNSISAFEKMELRISLKYFLVIVTGCCLLATLISNGFYGIYKDDWNNWESKTCLEWNTVRVDVDPVFCQIITNLQEPVSQTSSSWVSAVCKCTDNPCLQSHANNGTQVHCWYEPKNDDNSHAKVQIGPHPDTDPTSAHRSFVAFLVLTCIFGAALVVLLLWEGNCRKRRGILSHEGRSMTENTYYTTV